jgi:hypothetical protein
MTLPASLTVGLKEWAVLDSALESGRQILLLRKGGISESIGGFQLEHSEFVIFPTYLHQNATMLKSPWAGKVARVDAEPGTIRITIAAEVTDILRVRDRKQIDALDDQHIWLPPLIDMRFNYRPENPLYLILIRASRLPQPVTIDNTPAYAGCKSWVPLSNPIPTVGATPVLSDADFQTRREVILHRMA